MPNVYIINRGSGHTFENAKKFGQLVYMSNGPMSKYATGKMFRTFFSALRESNPDDMILQTSLTTMNVIACCIFSKLHGHVNLLIYKNDDYIKRTIVFSDIEDLCIEKEVKTI